MFFCHSFLLALTYFKTSNTIIFERRTMVGLWSDFGRISQQILDLQIVHEFQLRCIFVLLNVYIFIHGGCPWVFPSASFYLAVEYFVI
jgi:hypothetical protein